MSHDILVRDLTTRVSTECKSLRTLLNGNQANLSALTTTQKGNLVAAINELKTLIDAVPDAVLINDAGTSSSEVWSSAKVSSELTAQLNAVLSGAPAALNTLDEIAAAIGDDANFAASVTAALGNRVRVDAAQGLTGPQQAQARANIGAVASTDVGPTDTDYVAIFNAGLV